MCSIAEIQKVFLHPSIRLFNPYSRKVFADMATCHTDQKGKHVYKCNNAECNHIHYQYHSCGNRHCMFCGSTKRDEWVEKLSHDLLPTAYYHVVFTLPHELNSLMLGNRMILYTLLLDSAKDTLLTLGKDKKYLGGTVGVTSILHTWGQDLSFHPHVHSIVSGGGINANGKWIQPKQESNTFLFPIQAMKNVYRAIFMKRLRKLIYQNKLIVPDDVLNMLKSIADKTWNVFAKAPFKNVTSVVEYLGRYTHKVAITHHRIQSIKEDGIAFHYKDYADSHKRKIMVLSQDEFLRRMEIHILPKRYVKIRHYGYMQNKGKQKRLNEIRSQLKLAAQKPYIKTPIVIRMLEKYQVDILKCRKCNSGEYQLVNVMNSFDTSVMDDFKDGGLPTLQINKAPPYILSMKYLLYI